MRLGLALDTLLRAPGLCLEACHGPRSTVAQLCIPRIPLAPLIVRVTLIVREFPLRTLLQDVVLSRSILIPLAPLLEDWSTATIESFHRGVGW